MILGLFLITIIPVLSGNLFEADARPLDYRARLSAKDAAADNSIEDVRAEINFGREVAARILGRFKLNRDDILTRYVNLVGHSLLRHTNRPELDFHFAVLDSDTINAYTAPGGYIFITLGALTLMEDEAELAGVLAHEIAHATEKHIVRELNIKGSEQSAAAGLAHLLGGAGDPTKMAFVQAVDMAMDLLFTKGLNKQDEFVSDEIGTFLLATAGYDPSALQRYLLKVKKSREDKLQVLYSTHPAFEERLAALALAISENGLNNLQLPTLKERFNATLR